MINFDDGYTSQLKYAKPILDKYGFKASFFVVCGNVGTQPHWMNWQAIAELQKDGMDIESHTMTHAHLNKLSTNDLNNALPPMALIVQSLVTHSMWDLTNQRLLI